MTNEKLRIISFYTGDVTLQAALANPRGRRLLWLEILLNGDIPWQAHLDQPEVRRSYDKACAWYARFKTMIEGHAGRRALEARPGAIDMREYRTLLEALNFVSGRS